MKRSHTRLDARARLDASAGIRMRRAHLFSLRKVFMLSMACLLAALAASFAVACSSGSNGASGQSSAKASSSSQTSDEDKKIAEAKNVLEDALASSSNKKTNCLTCSYEGEDLDFYLVSCELDENDTQIHASYKQYSTAGSPVKTFDIWVPCDASAKTYTQTTCTGETCPTLTINVALGGSYVYSACPVDCNTEYSEIGGGKHDAEYYRKHYSIKSDAYSSGKLYQDGMTYELSLKTATSQRCSGTFSAHMRASSTTTASLNGGSIDISDATFDFSLGKSSPVADAYEAYYKALDEAGVFDYSGEDVATDADDGSDSWTMSCTWCDGTGKCSSCGGTGKLYGHVCGECQGSGKCSYCGGKKVRRIS